MLFPQLAYLLCEFMPGRHTTAAVMVDPPLDGSSPVHLLCDVKDSNCQIRGLAIGPVQHWDPDALFNEFVLINLVK